MSSHQKRIRYLGHFTRGTAYDAARKLRKRLRQAEAVTRDARYLYTVKGFSRFQNAVGGDVELFGLIIPVAKPFYKYLEARTLGLGAKKSINRLLKALGIENSRHLLTPAQIFEIEKIALLRARWTLPARAFHYEPDERAQGRIMAREAFAPYLAQYPDGLADGTKLTLLCLVPDFILLGVQLPGLTLRHHGIIIEVDGEAHAFKAERDALRDFIAAQLGFYVLSLDSASVRYGKTYVSEALGEMRPGKSSAANNLRLQLALWNIATWLTPSAIDGILCDGYGIQAGFETALADGRPEGISKAVASLMKLADSLPTSAEAASTTRRALPPQTQQQRPIVVRRRPKSGLERDTIVDGQVYSPITA